MKQKHSTNYDKTSTGQQTILLAVIGMSPAVLTETIWALAHQDIPIIPDRVIAVTTTAGRSQIINKLLSPNNDFKDAFVWDALRQTLESNKLNVHNKLRFGDTGDDIRVFTDSDPSTHRSRELDDIRTPDQNSAAADFIMEQVRQITENPDTRLIASIAGGRKTMGALLYAAMSLLGRHQDRLTHVLVNEPFENPALRPTFFFPLHTPITHILTDHSGKTISKHPSNQAQLSLADVPFVRLRYLFPKQIGKYPGKFTQLVQAYERKIVEVSSPPRVEILFERRTAIINDKHIPLNSREFPLFCFLYEHATNGNPPFSNSAEAGEAFEPYLSRWTEKHPEINLSHGGVEWHKNFNPEDLRKPISSLRKKLESLGLGNTAEYLFPRRGPIGFKLQQQTKYPGREPKPTKNTKPAT